MFIDTPLDATMRQALQRLYKKDPTLATIEKLAGPLPVRAFEPTFTSLIKIVVSQQLSTKVADAIFARVQANIDVTPQGLLAATEEDMRAVGLSRNKIICCKAVAQSVADGELTIEALNALSDDDINTQLTRIKGIGPWSAEIFMLFGLRRSDIFPAGDLALQIAYQKLKGLDVRPDRNQLITCVEPLRPYRSFVAHLLWHYYHYLNITAKK